MATKALNTGLIHEELESRLLFSGGVETVLVADSLPGDEPAIVETVSVDQTEILTVEQTQQADSTAEPAHEVVFIDENVDNYEQLMADLATRNNIDVYILDTGVDGIDQISAVLANYQGLDAVHLFSHGNEQGLMLGNGTLDSGNLANYSAAISGWQSALSEQADLLIYGCDLASGADGQALLANLQTLTGTDVAASDDLTGLAALGGDWDLEYQAGTIETSIAFSQDIQQNWAGVLMGSNTAPSGTNNTVVTQEDSAYTFGTADFGFTDGDGNNLMAVKITTLPGAGSLTLNGNAVTAGQTIAVADITGNKLIFTPAADANGSGYAAFTFQVQDDGGTAMGGVDLDQSPNTMTLNVTAVNDAPTGGVSITGSATEDQTLTVNTAALADVDGLGAFSYTWQRDGVNIAGATANTYTLGDADVGASITATVKYTDGDGTLETLVSGATSAVANINDVPTGGISITGTATEDQTLTANTAALADADGLGAFSYTWQRDGVDIAGATASTYTLGDADVGAAITAKVSYTDAHGTVETITSGATSAVANINDAPTGGASITGTATEGQTLTADTSSVADADGLGVYSYTWQRDGVDIAGATASSYTLTNADVGAAITAKVNYTDGHGTAETITSGATAAVSTINSTPPAGTTDNTDTNTSTTTTTSTPVDTTTAAYPVNPENVLSDTTQPDSVTPEVIAEQASDGLSEVNIVFDMSADNRPTVVSSPVNTDILQPSIAGGAQADAANPALIASVNSGQDFANRIDSVPVPPIDTVTMNPFLQKALDELNQHLGSEGHAAESEGKLILTTVSGVTIVLTTAYVSWAVQSGSILTALTKTLPAWSSFDPLAVLNGLVNRGV